MANEREQGTRARRSSSEADAGQGTSREQSAGAGAGTARQTGEGQAGGTQTGLARATGGNPLQRGPAGWSGTFQGFATPLDLMRRVGEEMAYLLESIEATRSGLAPRRLGQDVATGSGGAGAGERQAEGSWMPSIEIEQKEGAMIVRLDLPGVKADAIDVTIADGMLAISGVRVQEQREQQDGFVRTERRYGRFLRTVPLPEGADENRVEAELRDGVLEMRVPVEQRETGRRVEVRA
jgi:HSP20 family protein